MRSSRKTLPTIALIAGAVVAMAVIVGSILFLRPRDPSPREFTVPIASLSVGGEPYCDESLHVCVVETETGRYLALVILDTHPHFRDRGCTTPWRADFDLAQVNGPAGATGAFRSGCSGATFDRTGRLLFGPAPRDLDRFATEVRGEKVIVLLDKVIQSPAR